MKKFYSLLLIISISTLGVFGQVPISPMHKNKVDHSHISHNIPKFSPSHASARIGNSGNSTASIIWTDDFSDATNWSITHAPGTVSDWVIGTNGPSGMYAIPAIQSTSAANGFAMFDSDLMCDQTNGQIGDLTTVNPINTTGHPAVKLRFEESYCRFYDSTYIYVSTDNVNWTKYEVNGTLTANDYAGGGTASTGASQNPVSVSIDISATAGNQATVYIRFEFYSPMSIGPLAGCAYAWMVDDVVLEDLPADDAGMVPSFPSPYVMIPISQVQPINLDAQVINSGPNTETNLGFDASVYISHDFGATYTQVFNGPSNAEPTLASGATSSTLSAGQFTFTDTGLYAFQYISFMDNADLDSTNDILTNFMYITDSTYARDYVLVAGTANPYGAPANSTATFGNIYDIYNPAIIKSVTLEHAFATFGGMIRADIYDVSGGAPNAVIASSADYTYGAADTSSQFLLELTLPLTTPISVPAGPVFVAITQLDLNNMGVGFTSNIFTPGTSFIQVDANPFDVAENFGLTGAWAIRPNLDIDDAVPQTEIAKGISVYPNPSNGKLYIHNNGQKENMTITVYNNVGQVVYSNSFSQMTTAMIDLSSQSSGVYSVQIKSEKEVTTKSVVISNR